MQKVVLWVALVGQSGPASEAAAGKNFYAAACFHTLAKTMLFFAGELLGLIGSFHLWHPLCAGKAFKLLLYLRLWGVVKCVVVGNWEMGIGSYANSCGKFAPLPFVLPIPNSHFPIPIMWRT